MIPTTSVYMLVYLQMNFSCHGKSCCVLLGWERDGRARARKKDEREGVLT